MNLTPALETVIALLGDSCREFRVNREAFGFRTLHSDWVISPRELSEHLLYYIAAGRHTGRVNGKAILAGPGTLLWLAPGTPHTFRMLSQRETVTLYHVRFSIGAQGDGPQRLMGLFQNLTSVRPFLQNIVDELAVGQPLMLESIRSLLRLVFIETCRRASAPRGDGTRLTPAQCQRLIALQRQNAAGRLDVGALAAELRLSQDYFARVFRRTFGIPPRAWLLRERIQTAAHRLRESNLNVSEIASEFGYGDVFLFSRQFKQVLGRSPRQYRNERA